MLKEREVRLIKKLLEHKKPITTEKMALFLGITSRTVKSDIKSINHELLTKETVNDGIHPGKRKG